MSGAILVPLDGSTLSAHALPLACQLARRLNTTLQLVHVHVPVVELVGAELGINGTQIVDTVRDTESRTAEQAYLDAMQQHVAVEQDLQVTTAILDGSIADAITTYGSCTNTSLIVMTTHGRGPISRFWLGSVADQLVRHSPIPILLLRLKGMPPKQTLPEFRRVLLPVDGTMPGEQLIKMALSLGQPQETHYILLHVIDPLLLVGANPFIYPSIPDTVTTQQREQEAKHYLDGIAHQLQQAGVHTSTHIVMGQSPASAILETAQRENVDLIAMATHGRCGLPRLMLGSVTDKVLRGADTPVLLTCLGAPGKDALPSH